ncbi:disease resistance At4g27190-like [Olea europaea subsp. europaea]|uniref:Disease resistance At4g27190-like n=1 Tax=Olea europaea subsp. europaea TaxID=158383 RepID=A0A8S0PRQ7_OLEEU|nr:disease resistance At4g27190-like [Olea europaea subsp. europaea]
MAEAIVSPFVQKPADYTIAAISLQFKYMFRYNRNIQNLSSKVQDLENKRNEVQLSVDQAKSNALVINPEVDAWLKKVDDLKEQADEFLNSTTNSEMRCLYLRCPNLKTRYLLSRNATKKITAIDELQVKGDKLGEVGVRAPLQLLPVHGSEALKSRISTKKEIIKALEDTRISIVGIYGLPGVGKTTMAQEVMTQVLKDKLFDEVAKVVVSKDVDIIRIQYELAEMLDLSINVTKMRILVILDDVWTDINLETLGIPSLNRPEGLKILLTSRDKLVLERMGARNIEVGVLSGEEAFAFFQNVAKISNDATGLKDIAEQVAEECKGLPLALEVVGKTLVNRELYVWRDALNQLRHYQHGDEELRVIHFSGVQIPSPIRLPPGLRTLCLFNCDLEIGLSFFESLKKLEILLFVGSSVSIDFRSDEMVELSNLRSLGLGLMEDPHILPPDEENEHIIKELSSLKDLKTFQIKAFDARVLTQLLQECSEQLEKLERFQICMNFFSQSDHFRRELNLHDIDGNMLLEPGIKSLMRRTDKLSLSVEGWNNPVIELVEDGFSDLKSLKLTGLDSEYLIDATGSIPSGIFGNLKYLELISMRYLKEIHNGNLPRMEPAPFRNLKETVVDSCPKIKRVFSESVAKCMETTKLITFPISLDCDAARIKDKVITLDIW